MVLSLISRSPRRASALFSTYTIATTGATNAVTKDLEGTLAERKYTIPKGRWVAQMMVPGSPFTLTVETDGKFARTVTEKDGAFPLVSDGTTTVQINLAMLEKLTGPILLVLEEAPPPSLLRLLRILWGGYRGAEPDRNEHPERGGHLHEAGQKLLHRESNTQQAAVVLGSPGNRNPSRARNLRNPDVGFPGTAAEIPDAEIRERRVFHSHEQACNLRYGDALLQLRRGIDSHNPTVTPLGVA